MYRNQGGNPRRISPLNYKAPTGVIYSDIRNLPLTTLRDLDIFLIEEVTETKDHRFQNIVFGSYDWDVGVMVVTINNVKQDMILSSAIDLGIREIKAMYYNALTDGFKWTGNIYDNNGDPVVGQTGRLQLRSSDKTDILHVKDNLASGTIESFKWSVGDDMYILLTSPQDVEQIANSGLLYQQQVAGIRGAYVYNAKNAPDVATLAQIVEGARASFNALELRYTF